MTKARKQANFRRKIAYVFFFFFIVNIALKLSGISTLDTASAVTASHALGMKITFFAAPTLFLIIAWFFARLSKHKSAEAESIEIGGYNW